MKLNNLYNYGDDSTFYVKSHTELNSFPVISDAGYDEDGVEMLFKLGIYDSAKENREYLWLAEHLWLDYLSFDELVKVTLKDFPATQISSNEPNNKQTKFTIKINYILRRINSYWQNQAYRCLVLYRRLFIGQSNEKIAIEFGIEIKTL